MDATSHIFQIIRSIANESENPSVVKNVTVKSGDQTLLDARIADLGFDSVESFELIMRLEDQFETELDEEAIFACDTVATLIALVAASQART